MKTQKAKKGLIKMENVFMFDQVNGPKTPDTDPTVIITTTVTNIFPGK